MLKTVSSITNAIGALNYKGTWNASTNTPALASGVGTKGDYYVVSVAGNTALDGISNWGIGDWAVFNGSVWQRVEGGADLNGVNLSVSGTTNLAGLTASTALALDASKNVVSVTNTGTGNNVLATSPQIATPTLTGDVQMSTGNLVVGTNGKGIDFSASAGGGSTSSLLDDYEEGTFTPSFSAASGAFTTLTYTTQQGYYTKIGNVVTFFIYIQTSNVDVGTASGELKISGLPYTAASAAPLDSYAGGAATLFSRRWTLATDIQNLSGIGVVSGTTTVQLQKTTMNTVTVGRVQVSDMTTGASASRNSLSIAGHYYVP
jgi:hypothetical protein